MTKTIFLICCVAIFFGCKKTIPQNPTPTPTKDTTQYGVPFGNVPNAADASIYQVNMRPFSPAGNFLGVEKRLDSIKSLGINVVYLMPIYPVGQFKSINSPYCIRDYKAIAAEFGTLADLRRLVDAAHSKNMSVVLDWVANHTAYDHIWIATHRDWYLQDASANIVSPIGTGWNDVAQLNFDNADMRLEMIKCMKYWIYAANIDGYRCDYADGVPLDFWRQAIDTLRNIRTHKLLLIAEGNRTQNFNVGFDFNFGFGFYGLLKAIYNNNTTVLAVGNLNLTEYANANNEQRVVRYTSNHDVNGSDGTPLALFGGRNGSIGAFLVSAYMKSVPMLYGSQEVGMTARIIFPFTSTKINWSLNPDITAEYKKILTLRANTTAIRQGTLTTYSNANVCAFTKHTSQEKILVMVNMRSVQTSYPLPTALANTSWTDAVSGQNLQLTTQLVLEPYQYFIVKQ